MIGSANYKAPVLERLVSSFGARSKLELLEFITSGRLNPQGGYPHPEAKSIVSGYGSTSINAAFAYRRRNGNRFNPPDWGAWYAAFDVETALGEVAFHLTRALVDAGSVFDNTTQYIELWATFDEIFADLREVSPTPSCLHEDEDPGYSDGQRLATTLREAGGNGIVYPSVRHSGGTCLVAFWPHLVNDYQQGATWRLTWAGNPVPSINKL